MVYSVLRWVAIMVVLISYSIGFGSAISITSSPESINQLTTKELNITCVADGPAYWAITVVSVEIGKKGEDPIALFTNNQLIKGPSMKDNMQAEGNITKDASQSYLRITIKDPSVENIGLYTCRIGYIESFRVKEAIVDVNITMGDIGVPATLRYFQEKITTLENSLHSCIGDAKNNKVEKDKIDRLEKNLLTQQNQMQELRKIVKVQEVEIMAQKEKMKSHQLQMEEQKEQMKNQKEQIDKQKEQMQNQEKQMKHQEMQTKNQELQMKNQEMQMKNLELQMENQKEQMKEQENQMKNQTQQMKEQNEQMKYQKEKMKDQVKQMKDQAEEIKIQKEQIKASQLLMEEQKGQFKNQKDEMKDHEEQLKNQEKQIKFQKKQMNDQENKLNYQTQQIKEQSKQMKNQTKEINNQKEQIKAHQMEIEEQKQQVKYQNMKMIEQQGQLKKIEDQENTVSAFYAALKNPYTSLANGDVLKFDNVQTNIGEDYKISTGVYKAPVHGLYTFQLFVMTYYGHDHKLIQVDIYVNDKITSSLMAESKDDYDQSSVTSVVELNSGDMVKCKVRNVISRTSIPWGDHYTGFSGHLIKRLN